MRDRNLRVLLAAGAAIGLTSMASADISQLIFRIDVSFDLGDGAGVQTHSFQYNQGDDQYGAFAPNGVDYDWSLNGGTGGVWVTGDETNPGVLLQEASVSFREDPVVDLSFGLVNNLPVDTNVTVTSGLVSFATLNNAEGNISATVGVIDTDGDGASLSPVGSGYTAYFNGGAPATGSVFATAFNAAVAVGPFGFTSVTEDFPGPGTFAPMGAVSDASAQFTFVLSADDAGNGVATYTIIPTSGTLALLGLGGLTALRRRR